MLLRRTTATAVSRVYENFLSAFPSIESLAEADVEDISRAINTLGLQNMRAKHLHDTAVLIRMEFDGRIPDAATELAQLPGLGAYGVAAVLNFAFQRPVPMVDGNVVHLLNRFFGLTLSVDDSAAWELMQRFGGKTQKPSLYWGIIDLVAAVCLRRGPHCRQCPLCLHCVFHRDLQSL